MKKLIAMVLVTVMLFALAACVDSSPNATISSPSENTPANTPASPNTSTGNPNTETVQQGNTGDTTVDTSRPLSSDSKRYPSITIAMQLEANNLQPYSNNDAGCVPILACIYETLLDQYGLTEFSSRLAKNHYEKDATHYIVELYDYIKDSKGNNIKASDVAFSYKNLIDSGTAPGDFGAYFDSAVATGDYTVEFTWKKPIDSLTAFGTIMTYCYIVNEAEYKAGDFANKPVGTGPYVVKDYVTGAYTLLAANDNYWQKEGLIAARAGRNVQEIRYDIILDAAQRLIALEAGMSSFCQLDNRVLPDYLSGGKYESKYQVFKYPQTQNQMLLCNMSGNSIMSDINMRLAVFYAIDVVGMTIAMGPDTNAVATVDAAPAIPDYLAKWDTPRDDYYFVTDLTLAKDYLQKAGYNGEKITLLSGNFTTKKLQAEMINTILTQDLGLNIDLQIVENAVEQQKSPDSANWDIYLFSAGSNYTVADKLNRTYGRAYGKVAGLPINFLSDDMFEDMITRGITTSGYSEQLMDEIMQYTIDNALSYGLMVGVNYYAYSLCYANLVNHYNSYIMLPGSCTYYLD